MSSEEQAKIVHPPNKIKEKIGNTANPRNMLRQENVNAGQETINARKDDFVEWARDDIEILAANLHEIQNMPMTSQHLENIIVSAEHLRDRGGTFNYNLLTKIAKSLVDYCATITKPSPDHAVVVSKHIEGLRIILGSEIEGDGGTIGTDLMESLTQLTDKYKAD